MRTLTTATNRLNGTGFTYDSNGKMTGWSTPSGSVTASYDIDNRMTSITTPSVTETYKYGVGNLRAMKYQGGAWTYSVYGAAGELLGTFKGCAVGGVQFLCEARLRVYFGGRLILNGWIGVRPDRLGSPDGTHGRVYPYGEVSGSVSPDQDETYTTYTRDAYTGLDYAKNRSYAYSWGRFLTADPYRASGGPENPQSWNRYAYVQNNPVDRNDPTGLMQSEFGMDGEYCYWDDEVGDIVCENTEGGGGGDSAVADFSMTVTSYTDDTPLSPLAQAVLGQVYDTTAMLTTPQFWATIGAASVTAGVVSASVGEILAADIPSVLYGDTQASFNFGASTQIISESIETMRVSSGLESTILGRWSTTEIISSAEQAQSLLALPPSNTAAAIGAVTILPGSYITVGTAAPLFGQLGGGFQIAAAVSSCVFGPVCALP